MNPRTLRHVLLAGVMLVLGLVALPGCSKKTVNTPRANLRPTVELTNAPVSKDVNNPYFYAYRLNWSGEDPDGRIDHFEY